MAAGDIVPVPGDSFEQTLASASPDVLREMVREFAQRIWAALKNYVANTAVSWPGRLRQIHAFCRARSPDQMLATAAPWTSPGCCRVTSRTSGMPAF